MNTAMTVNKTRRELQTKVDGLQMELEEARETLRAIVRGEADAIMVHGPEGDRVFTLRDAQHPYRVLVETMNEGAVTLTADGDIVYSNNSFARIVDTPLEKVFGSSLADHIAPGEAEALRALLNKGLEGRAKAELTVVTAAGQPVPVYFSVSPTDLESARGICVVATDLSAQRRAESIILESIKEAFCSFDSDFRFTFMNSAAERMFGRQRQQQLGESLWNWLGARGTRLEHEFRRVMEERTPRTFEYFHPDWGGWLEIKVCPTGEGGITGSFLDISLRKRAQEEVSRLNAELEQRVRARTAELEAANQELEAFSYTVSHDLRAPLRAISGFSQMLADDCRTLLDEKNQRHLQRIQGATHQMAHLIDGLLELSRAGRVAINVAEVNLSAMVQGIVEEMKLANPERNVHFVIADGLTARGDSRLLRDALENLIGNAWKFTSKRPEARIEFGGSRDEGGSTTYFVRDNGVGFDMEHAGKLFSAFQRLHRESEFPGSGIGLAVVERIIRRHAGRIWAEAAVDQGASFRFTLGEGDPREA